MAKDWMPKGGVKELQRSSSGRRYLEKLQKRHKADIVQPGCSEFDKRYGDKIKKQKQLDYQQERRSKDEWGEAKERRLYEANKAKDPGYKKYF